ncbi:autotransporter-associated beta strand repeat-containing protein [Luteolibacter arcticus]|uniref:Autotransporter-associated beta strand repeat-containing protein n=1 Tax=Luteolibacter arcticus TaxID=1581411 RepID=A0ABT3GK51_9BACT|nr:autotransporter-associated beta strand repeat-containing protein [Luteolibacter arcticus]MCW1923878.1 autotransporter-associated beta strand repeat-containing protein [Luteolibacter arcticus]
MKKTPRFIQLSILLGSSFQTTHAADNTWNGSASAEWGNAGNWTGGIPDTVTERAVFNGTGGQNAVTFAAAVGGGTGFNGILVEGTQASALSIDNSTGAALNFRLAASSGITINSGAAAFSLGTAGGNITLVPQTASIFTFQNDSSSTATLGNKITSVTGGGSAAFKMLFTGTGDWQVDALMSPGGGGGTPFITKEGGGTTTLSGANVYTGATTINAGTLKAGVVSVGNASGAFGKSSAVTLADVSGATLDITGFDTEIGSLAGGGATGGNITLGAATLTTGRSNTDTAYAGVISGTGGGLIKIGTGTQTLSGANTYSGTATVSGGTLAFAGASSLPAGSSLAVGGGAILSLADGTAHTRSLTGLNLASGSILSVDWTGAATDTLSATGAAVTSGPGVVTFRLNAATPTGAGHTLLHAASGLSGGNYVIANTTDFTAALNVTDTDVTIGSYAASGPLATAYWSGGKVPGALNAMALSTGSLSNWSSSATYAATGLIPAAATDIIFSTTTGASQQGSVVLGANLSANSLTFADTTPVTITADGHGITLLSPGTGSASAIHATEDATIHSPVVLGASQSWTVAASKTLAVAGSVSGAFGLTKSDSGTLALSAANTYSGGTTLGGGTLTFSHLGALGSGNVALGNNATLKAASAINGNLTSLNTLSVALGSTGTLEMSNGATNTSLGTGVITVDGTLKVNRSAGGVATNTFAGALSGAGTLELGSPIAVATGVGNTPFRRSTFSSATAFDNFTGNIHVKSGANLALFNGTLLSANSNDMTIDAGGYVSVAAGAGTTVIDVLNGSGALIKNSSTAFATVSIASGNFSGVIGTAPFGGTNPERMNLVKASTGTLTLSGVHGYGGTTTISDGTLEISGAGSLRSGNYSGAISNAGTLRFNSTANQILSGTISGAGVLVKDSTGILTLTDTASNYTGTTTINAGTLRANNASGSATGTNTVTVKSTGTLGGTGGVSGAVVLESGGTLAPGESIESLATGDLALPVGAILAAEINSSGTPSADVVNVTGNVTLGGTLAVTDIAGTPAAITLGTKLTLITYSGTLGGTFSGLAEGATFTVGLNAFKIRYADSAAVTLEAVTVGGGYSSWASTNAPAQTANQDFDGDGVANGVEYVLGGLATTNDLSKLPTVSVANGDLVFTFLRDQDSKTPDTSVVIDVGTTLVTWPLNFTVGNNTAGSTIGVTVTDNLNGTDTVKLTVAQAPDAKKFARLRVEVAP